MGNERVCDDITLNALRFNHYSLTVGLTQWVNESTIYRSGSTLDLILTSEELVKLKFVFIFLAVVDHIIQISLNPQRTVVDCLWYKGKYNQIKGYLSKTD